MKNSPKTITLTLDLYFKGVSQEDCRPFNPIRGCCRHSGNYSPVDPEVSGTDWEIRREVSG